MQNAGHYAQGAVSTHQYVPPEPSVSCVKPTGGSTTSSLRQFRKKDVEKTFSDPQTSVAETHVARVAPHNHYPPRTNDCYRPPYQFQDYSLPAQVKYSEIADPLPQAHIPNSVIQKPKNKDYMDMCSVQQSHMKQTYPEMVGGQQSYAHDNALHPHHHPHHQYLHKEPTAQMHPAYKPESQQYFAKEPQYQQLPHQVPKYNGVPAQMRKYPPSENVFLSKLSRIHPGMARSIMSDHHLQENQAGYPPTMDQRMYGQNQRYYAGSMQGSPYVSNNYPIPTSHYSNYPPNSCNYPRGVQMSSVPPRFPLNHHNVDRSTSPRRSYPENLSMSVGYPSMSQKMSPNYPQYTGPEYAQHYQHRRSQEYYQQHFRPTEFVQNHQMPAPELPESRVSPSDSLKKFIENWDAGDETAVEITENCKETIRIRDDQSTETVFMINASELQYFENNGLPVCGVTLDNNMLRIIDNKEVPKEPHEDHIVNLHIMESPKPDCMLANRNEILLRQQIEKNHNTVLQTPTNEENGTPEAVEASNTIEDYIEDTIKSSRELVDKNCSPINVEQMENLEEPIGDTENDPGYQKIKENLLERLGEEQDGRKSKNMPVIDQGIIEQNEDKIPEELEPKLSVVSSNFNLKNEETGKETPTVTTDSKTEEITVQNYENIQEHINIFTTEETTNIENTQNENLEEEISGLNKEETITDENINTKNNDDDLKINFEETDENCSSGSSKRRTRRIFSVDDIMNNVGAQLKTIGGVFEDCKLLKITKKFIEEEKKNSSQDATPKITTNEEMLPVIVENTDEDNLKTEEIEGVLGKIEETVEPELENTCSIINCFEEANTNNLQEKNEETVNKPQVEEEEIEERNENVSKLYEELESKSDSPSNEIQYRSAIKVEENNVLLHIAGELVEVNVNVINGKKIITVVPISETTMVDFNDNYETMSTPLSESPLPEEINNPEEETTAEDKEDHNLEETDDGNKTTTLNISTTEENQEEQIVEDLEYPTEPSEEIFVCEDVVVEQEISDTEPVTTSYMSFEENIEEETQNEGKFQNKLPEISKNVEIDAGKLSSQIICTKAAKKSYECDLQIPAVTTSEDIKTSGTLEESSKHDKVSSSKSKPRIKEKLIGDEDKLLKKKSGKVQKKSKTQEVLKKLMKAYKETNLDEKTETEDSYNENEDKEEYVDFKELLKARKLKKLKKMQQIKNEQNSKNEPNETVKETKTEITEKNKIEDSCEETQKNNLEMEKVNLQDTKIISPIQIVNCRDPRRKDISEPKRKLSLQEYNNRKKKQTDENPKQEHEDTKTYPKDEEKKRTKSLDDSNVETCNVPKEPLKRSLSCEVIRKEEQIVLPQRVTDLPVKTLHDFKPSSSKDETLEAYKEQVDSKLNSLNIQIPKYAKTPSTVPLTVDKDDGNLVQRFLNDGRMTVNELDRLKKLVTVKKLVQKLSCLKSPERTRNATYEVRSSRRENDIKLHLKKLSNGKKAGRSRASEETTPVSSPTPTTTPTTGDYSVVQYKPLEKNGVPKLILKRKTESIQQPVVRLERLDMDLVKKRRVF